MSGYDYDYHFSRKDYLRIIPSGACEKCKKKREIFEYNGKRLCVDCLDKAIKPKGDSPKEEE